MTITPTTTSDLSAKPLEKIALLLQQCADQLWAAADRTAGDATLQQLGLTAFLVAGQATDLLPADHEFTEDYPTTGTIGEHLDEAEQLTRALDPQLVGSSDLSIAVADIRREARHHGDL